MVHRLVPFMRLEKPTAARMFVTPLVRPIADETTTSRLFLNVKSEVMLPHRHHAYHLSGAGATHQ